MAAAGATKALCVNQEVGNVAMDLRRQASPMPWLSPVGPWTSWLWTWPIRSMQQRIAAAVTANEDVDSILALGPTGAAPTLAAMDELGREDILLATFDLSPEVLDAVEEGRMLFAIDQQQYLQGYLPIVMLTLYNTNLNTVANDVIMTGPGFVTADNAAQVKDLSAAGTR
ncbi:MAG: substrate-binding domain-containing protein [Caldilineaceae bacterium]